MQTPSEAPKETPSEEPMQTPSEAPNETTSEEPMQTPSETPSASPSEVPTQTPSEAPSKEPDSLFSGLSDEQSLSKEALAEKEVLALHAQEPERFLIGAEYVENEILVSADTYE